MTLGGKVETRHSQTVVRIYDDGWDETRPKDRIKKKKKLTTLLHLLLKWHCIFQRKQTEVEQ